MDITNSQIPDGIDSDSAAASAIPLAPMRQQIEVRDPQDDWTGVQSAAERRKLQNRLNARLYQRGFGRLTRDSGTLGKRRGANQRRARPDGAIKPPGYILMPKVRASGNVDVEFISRDDPGPSQPDVFKPVGTLCGLTTSEADEVIQKFGSQAYQDYVQGSPRVDQLLTLIQFNVFRALVSNTASMGFTKDWMCDDGAKSPFSDMTALWASDTCPPSLCPTELQLTIPHHPWFDLFPFPALRDNILLQGEDFDDAPLCLELVEFCDLAHEQTGVVVWGEPHDPMAWEVSESFAGRWAWVLKGAWELKESTNRWRVSRGEQPLVFDID